MTLVGANVVVCRAEDQAGPLLDALHAAGAQPLHLPLIEIVPPADDGQALANRLADADGVDWLAITSSNAVRAVDLALDGRRPEPAIAVVGRATADAVAERGWSVAFTPTQQTASGLAAELPVEPGARILAPMAEDARPDLVDGLTARGVRVEVVVAYRNRAPVVSPDQLAGLRRADALTVTSPSTIDRLVGLIDAAELPPLVAIGPTSAAAIEAHGLVVAAIADHPSVDGLIAALTRTLSP